MQRHPHVCEPRNLYLAECSECEILEQAIEDLDTKVEKYNKEIRNTLSNHDTRITANKTAIDKLRTDLDTCCAEVKATLATKQDKLTAGSNISISGNTISAIDTKYTAGTNVSISSGNVISATNTDTKYSAGNGLSLSGTTFSIKTPQVLAGQKTNWNLTPDTTTGDFVTYNFADLWTAPSAGYVVCTHQLSFLDNVTGLRNSTITKNGSNMPTALQMQRKSNASNVINSTTLAFTVTSGDKVGVRVAQRNPDNAATLANAYVYGLFFPY